MDLLHLIPLSVMSVVLFLAAYFSHKSLRDAQANHLERIESDFKSIKKQYLIICKMDCMDVLPNLTIQEMMLEITKFQKRVLKRKNKK